MSNITEVTPEDMEVALGFGKTLRDVQRMVDFYKNPEQSFKELEKALNEISAAAAEAYNNARTKFDKAFKPDVAHLKAIEVAKVTAQIALLELDLYPAIDL